MPPDPQQASRMIPRILHQTWISDDVPPHLRAYRQSWLRHHPDWEHRLWTDAKNECLIAERYPDFLPYFRSAVPPILRIDLVRLAYLHAFGGVYADLDYELLRPLDPLLDTSHALVAREHGGIGMVIRGHDFIINALLASPPAHPLWLDVMHAMVNGYRPRRMFERHTPYVVRMAIAMLDEHAERRSSVHGDVTILAHQLVYPASPTTRIAAQRGHAGSVHASFGVHHYDNSWRTPLDRVVNVGRSLVQRLGH
jgi:hypothetical protein